MHLIFHLPPSSGSRDPSHSTVTNFFALALAAGCFAGLTPATAESLPANTTTAYSAVIHFDRMDYVVENRFKSWTPTTAAAGLETAIVFTQGAFMEPDASGHMTLSADYASRVAFVAGAAPNAELTLGMVSLYNIAGKPAAIQTFIGELQALITTYGFTGIDFDWEDMPNSATYTSPAVYGQTIKAISDVLRPQGIVISTSHAQGNQYKPYVAAIVNVVDYVNLQFYYAETNAMDMPAFKSSLAAYVNLGLKASQIRIGLPSYGMVGGSINTTDKWRSWNDMRNAGVDLINANQWKAPNNLTYYFSGLNLIDAKIRYAMANGFGGVFTWELTQDTNYTHPLSINRRIDELAAETPLLELNNANNGGGALGTGSVNLGSGGVLNNGLLRFARDGATIYSNWITGSGRLETTGTGNPILTGTNSYSGGTLVGPGSRLNIGNGGTIGSVTGPIEVNGTLAINRSDDLALTNALTGSGTFVKSGAGRLSLPENALPATLATFSISGGTAENTGDLTFPGNVLIGDNYNGGFTQNTGTVTFSKSSSDWGKGVNIGYRLSGIGRYDLNGGTLNVPNAPVILTAGPSDGTLLIAGGTANLKGIAIGTSNSGTGRLHLSGGRLNLGSRGIFNWTPPNNDAVREINLGAATLGANDDWSSALNMALTDSTQGLTIATGDSETPEVPRFITLSGSISGDGKLTKTGAGVLTLNGLNSYIGTTTVTGGRLVLHGSLTSATTVGDSATLRGSGTITAAVTVQSGGTLTPDEGATLTTGTLTLASGSTLRADGDTTVTGDLDVTGAHLVVSSAPELSPRVLVTYSGARFGDFAATTVPAGWKIEVDDAAGEIRLVAAPAGYDGWIANFETNGQAGFTDDANGDGIANGLVFVLGGDPRLSGDTALPIFEKLPAAGFRYSFTRDARARGHATIVAKLSDDLLTWPQERDIDIDAAPPGSGVEIIDLGDHDEISIEFPGDAPQTFIRLEVSEP